MTDGELSFMGCGGIIESGFFRKFCRYHHLSCCSGELAVLADVATQVVFDLAAVTELEA